MTLVLGVTGGIASGKSTVAAIFAKLGAVVVSADSSVSQPGAFSGGTTAVTTQSDIQLKASGSALMNVKARNEERFLVGAHGAAYDEYCRRTGRFLPRVGRTAAAR